VGGAVLFGPFDVEGVGRMAVVRDPAGLVFALWEARGHIGARLVGEDDTLCWTEIVTPDEKGAEKGALKLVRGGFAPKGRMGVPSRSPPRSRVLPGRPSVEGFFVALPLHFTDRNLNR